MVLCYVSVNKFKLPGVKIDSHETVETTVNDSSF